MIELFELLGAKDCIDSLYTEDRYKPSTHRLAYLNYLLKFFWDTIYAEDVPDTCIEYLWDEIENIDWKSSYKPKRIVYK